jgi:uncharacterized protein YnzC (UPF0291/DUF896 family)
MRALRDADEIGVGDARPRVRRPWIRGLRANFRRVTTSIDVIDETGT